MSKSHRRILGIDPGTSITGYGVISVSKQGVECEALGVIDLHLMKDHYNKLLKIYTQFCNLIDEYNVDEVAIESPFVGRNAQSMFKLSRAQGAAIIAAVAKDKPVFEYPPRKVKQVVTENGGATKEEVAEVLKNTLRLKDLPDYLDSTDALAIALCHFRLSS